MPPGTEEESAGGGGPPFEAMAAGIELCQEPMPLIAFEAGLELDVFVDELVEFDSQVVHVSDVAFGDDFSIGSDNKVSSGLANVVSVACDVAAVADDDEVGELCPDGQFAFRADHGSGIGQGVLTLAPGQKNWK